MRKQNRGQDIMEKQFSLMLRLSQHLQPSSTVGTKAQAGCHLPGMLKQELLFQMQGSTSPLLLPQLTDFLMLKFEKLSLFFQHLLWLTFKCQNFYSSLTLCRPLYYSIHCACFLIIICMLTGAKLQPRILFRASVISLKYKISRLLVLGILGLIWPRRPWKSSPYGKT